MQTQGGQPPIWFWVRMLIARIAIERAKRSQAKIMVVERLGGYSNLSVIAFSSVLKLEV